MPDKRPRPTKPRRKFVLIEVETTLTNADVRHWVPFAIDREDLTVVQIQINAAKKDPRK